MILSSGAASAGSSGELIIYSGAGNQNGGAITIEGRTGNSQDGGTISILSEASPSGTSNSGIVSIGPSSVS
jgi:hypothetical protein